MCDYFIIKRGNEYVSDYRYHDKLACWTVTWGDRTRAIALTHYYAHFVDDMLLKPLYDDTEIIMLPDK